MPLAPGLAVNIVFDEISITEQLSIQVTDFSEEFAADRGTVSRGPCEITLELGNYTRSESYMPKNA